MRIISYCAAGVFLIFFGGIGYTLMLEGKFVSAFFLCVFGILPAILMFLERKRAEKRKEFPAWIKANLQKIEKGQAIYKGVQVGLDTKLVRYKGCISVILGSFKFTSEWKFIGQDKTTKLLYTICTFLLGWWEFPDGIISSYKAIRSNFRGGKVVRLRKIIGKL